jgi:hypothetical protein
MRSLHASRLVPPGFSASGASSDDEGAVITMRATSADSSYPCCGVVSRRVHSLYARRLADLPIAGRRVLLMLQARRFRCEAVLCGRHIFAERFNDNILKLGRGARLDSIGSSID